MICTYKILLFYVSFATHAVQGISCTLFHYFFARVHGHVVLILDILACFGPSCQQNALQILSLWPIGHLASIIIVNWESISVNVPCSGDPGHYHATCDIYWWHYLILIEWPLPLFSRSIKNPSASWVLTWLVFFIGICLFHKLLNSHSRSETAGYNIFMRRKM